MPHKIFTHSRPYSCELKGDRLVFNTYKGSRYEDNYQKLNEFFLKHYQIQDEHYRKCNPITLRGDQDTYIGAIAVLNEGWLAVYENNGFLKFSEYAVEQRSKISNTDTDEKLTKFDTQFLTIVTEKNQSLLSQNTRLREIALKLEIDLSAYSEIHIDETSNVFEQIKSTVKANHDLVVQNQKIHEIIVQLARLKAAEYNDSACRATIAHAVMLAIKNNSKIELNAIQQEILIGECKSHYPNYENEDSSKQLSIQKEVGAKLAPIPESGKTHEYINPEELFPSAEKDRGSGYVTFSDSAYHLGNNIHKLSENIDKIQIHKVNADEEITTFISFWKTIKNFFNDIWTRLVDALTPTTESTKMSKNMALNENVDNVVEEKPITENARLIHKFNSQKSPLIALIYDETIAEEKKLEIFKILASTEKYNGQTRNVDIAAEGKNNSYSFKGEPLLHATKLENLELMTILLQNKANPNAGGLYIGINHLDCDGVSPLHIAVAQNNLKAVELLVQHGADINVVNEKGQTPLHAASNDEITKYLISKGADINRKDQQGNSPLHMAVKHNYPSVVKCLLSQESIVVDSENNLGNTPLGVAAYYGVPSSQGGFAFYNYQSYNRNKQRREDNLACLNQLLDARANINHQNLYGYSPLHLAVCVDRDCMGKHSKTDCPDYEFVKEKVALLCKREADPNLNTKAKDFSPKLPGVYFHYNNHPIGSSTPLQALYQHQLFDKIPAKQRKAVAEILVQHSANPKVDYSSGYTLLHQCAYNGDATALAYFIEECGLNVNAETKSLNTPLFTVIHSHCSWYRFSDGGKACLDVLVQNGVDMTAKVPHVFIVSYKTLKGSGWSDSLTDAAIRLIFKDEENIFSKQAREKGIDPLDVNIDNSQRRELLRTIFIEQGKQEVSVKIELYPEEVGKYTGQSHSLAPSAEAIEYIEELRKDYIEQHKTSSALQV